MKLSKVATMGRPESKEHDNNANIKFALCRVLLNSGGYDAGGAYWGTPSNLYCAEGLTPRGQEYDHTIFYFRAESREAAKAHVRKAYPNARFYR